MIPKSTRHPEVIVNNHPVKQTVFANKKAVPGKALYAMSIATGRKQTENFLDNMPKSIRHREFNQMQKNGSAQFKTFLGVIRRSVITLTQR